MQIKICGITNYEDAIVAIQAGAAALGFNFYKKSKRYISPDDAQHIIKQLPSNIKKVGVFVNESSEKINLIFNMTGIDLVQLHGGESFEFSERLQLPVIKTIRPQSSFKLEECFSFEKLYAILIDAYSKTEFGGTNQLADWNIAKKIATTFPTILAGGINANNLQAAISCVNPMSVDVCSGVELSPGKKCKQKLQHFFSVLKGTYHE